MLQEPNRAYRPKEGAPSGNEETPANASTKTTNPAMSPPPKRSPLATFALTVRRSSRPACGLNGEVGVGSHRQRRNLYIWARIALFLVHKEGTAMSMVPDKRGLQLAPSSACRGAER